MKNNVINLVLIIFLSLNLNGCGSYDNFGLTPQDQTPWHATLKVYNKTGHDIWIDLGGNVVEYVKDNESITKEYSGHYSSHPDRAAIKAYKEELDAARNVIWSYSYNNNDYLGQGTNITELKPEMNEFVMPPLTISMTNKTGTTLGISEGNISDGVFLILINNEVGRVTINQIITDKNNKSFYFFIVNADNTYGPPLRMTLNAIFITDHRNSGIDIPAELLTKGVVTY